VLRVRIIDTPGYGDRLDNKRAVAPIVDYAHDALRRQYARERSASGGFTSAEQQLHCALYFVSPHRLLQTDRHFLNSLQRFMPVVVVIAKADTLTDDELATQRRHIRRSLAECGVRAYTFLEDVGGELDLEALRNGAISGGGWRFWCKMRDRRDESQARRSGKSALSEAEAAAEATMEKQLRGPRFSRGRRPGDPLAVLARPATYPWGSVDCKNPEHSDFTLLQRLLLSHHTERLVEIARARYRAYRCMRVRCGQVCSFLWTLALAAGAAQLAGIQLLELRPPPQLVRALSCFLAQPARAKQQPTSHPPNSWSGGLFSRFLGPARQRRQWRETLE